MLAAAYDGDGERIFQIDHQTVEVQAKDPDTTIWQAGKPENEMAQNGAWTDGTAWEVYGDRYPAVGETQEEDTQTDAAADTERESEAPAADAGTYADGAA